MEKTKNNSKTIVIFVVGILALIGIIGGLTYAFFNYTRTGSANVLKVGRISFISRQEETINLTNVFPIASSAVDTDTDNVGLLEIEIEGDTDYVNGLEYLITVTNAHVYTGGKTVPISLDVDIDDLGTESDNYFTARNSKNATIYKRLSGDSIVGDQMLLVGYIMPNSVTGTAEGVDGTITIKAYIDEERIAISDTYDGMETDYNGTTNEWVDNRVVLTTDEWNALQTSGISFQVKVEANEGIWVDEPIYNMLRLNSVMDNINSTYVNNTTPGIDFSKISGDTNGKGLYTRAGTENDAYPVVYYRGDVDNNNVFLGGYCWLMVRTTETGGVKMMYNGENTGTTDAPACENALGTSRQIYFDNNGVLSIDFEFSEFTGNGVYLYDSPAYVGYMYGNEVYKVTNGNYTEGAYFGNSFTYDDTTNRYTLVDTQIGIDDYHHYTCNLTTADGTCESIRFYSAYFLYNGNANAPKYMYYTLSGGDSIEDAIIKMKANEHDSYTKEAVEKWYEYNLENTEYNNIIEDTIYCNDRSISKSNYEQNGINPNGGTLSSEGTLDTTSIVYAPYTRLHWNAKPSLKCKDVNDSFTVSSEKGNGDASFPIGLITADELTLAGASSKEANQNFYLYNSSSYWTMSPNHFDRVGGAFVNSFYSSLSTITEMIVVNWYGLQPVISLKLGTSIVDGEGTGANPYIVK